MVYLNKLFVCIVFYVSSSNVVHALIKRSDLEIQICIDNFDVLKDKIIRTQDSRNMGATYLNELDLGSREECLRLCCETDTCDVFVYEEKSPGSCYLFHCGPPEDFKCKFTRHANYSSAILSISRHLNELENQIKLTKHEQDLSRLRKPEGERPPRINSKEEITTQKSLTTVKTKVVKEILPQVAVNKTSKVKLCSRYQFECHTSGECIAIYNACDGIPQCADGSDEAPELGCPIPSTTPAPLHPPPLLPLPVARNNIFEQNNQLRKSLPPLIDNFQQSPVQPNPGNDIRSQSVNQRTLFNEQQSQQAFIPPQSTNNNNWVVNHPGNQMPILASKIAHTDKNSHIFNHKENGLQVLDSSDRYKYKGAIQTLHHALAIGQFGGAGGANPQYTDMNVRNDYSKLSNYYGDAYRPQYQIPENWQPNQPPINAEMDPYINSDNWQPPQIPQTHNTKVDQNNPVYHQNINVKPNWKEDLINTQAESKSYDHTIIREPKEFEHASHQKETNKELTKAEHEHINIQKDNNYHSKTHSHVHVSGAEELKQNMEDLLDGEAERPGGAILSLTLGVSLTCIMAILIGCRLRIVRRRMRRGGKSPYAHDADYLVNGMYL